ncbi:hypothetical protein COM21_00955 [Bacillus toyonensis]|uniref:hypothetical protein n=1 Tax=Bacillus toyonensis TaxID=155322 RepID=UPI000BF2EFA1|nr:hypothetical protein [Bacillus toyonensis]PGC70399.1 hypothetical protein COM21_00955 [Bacillus toyonensis]
MKKWIKPIGIALGLFLIYAIIQSYQLLMDVWIENNAEDVYKTLNALFAFKIPIFIFGPLCVVICLVGIYFYGQYQKKVDTYEEKLNDHGRTLLRKYSELNQFEKQKSLDKIMESHAKKHMGISAIQLYTYVETPHKNHFVIQINHANSFAKERININAMAQNYYYIDKKMYTDFKKSLKSVNNNKIEPLLIFIDTYLGKIKNKTSYRGSDAITFLFLQAALDLLAYFYPNSYTQLLDDDKNKQLEELNNDMRTGILMGIILGTHFTFENKSDGNKSGRRYATYPFIINKTKYILLMTIDTDLLSETEQSQNAEIKRKINEFVELVSNSFVMEYNNTEDGEDHERENR